MLRQPGDSRIAPILCLALAIGLELTVRAGARALSPAGTSSPKSTTAARPSRTRAGPRLLTLGFDDLLRASELRSVQKRTKQLPASRDAEPPLIPRGPSTGTVPPPPPLPGEDRARCLYLLLKFVDWPKDALPARSKTLTVGVFGRQAVPPLTHVMVGRSVHGRRVVIRRLTHLREMEGVQCLFVSADQMPLSGRVIRHLRAKPVLTVGNSNDFARRGGVIGFDEAGGQTRVVVNLDAARTSRIHISSRLLAIAGSVRS